MRYDFGEDSLMKVSASSWVDASLASLVCDMLLEINLDKIENDQSYVEINEDDKPYIEIKILASQGLSIPIEIYMYEQNFELWIGCEGSVAIESFNAKKKSGYLSLKKELSKWFRWPLKAILFFKGKDIYKTDYRYFDGKRFRPLYFEIAFKSIFWTGRREEKIYRPWID